MKNIYKKKLHKIISKEIKEESFVLDLGCGDGKLLDYLIKTKNVTGHGIDKDLNAIISCVEKGIPVVQMDLDNLPFDFETKSFDTVILNQTVQQLHYPAKTIEEILRIGKEAVVTFPNFGNIIIRLLFLLHGKMPMTKELPYLWYNSPNIHLLTIKDFYKYCKKNNIKISNKIFLKRKLFKKKYKIIKNFSNIRSDIAIFKIKK